MNELGNNPSIRPHLSLAPILLLDVLWMDLECLPKTAQSS